MCRQGIGQTRPVGVIRDAVALHNCGRCGTTRQAKQQAGAAHNPFVGGQNALEEHPPLSTTHTLGQRTGDQRTPERGTISGQKPLLAQGCPFCDGNELHVWQYGRLGVGLAVDRDAVAERGYLGDPRLM